MSISLKTHKMLWGRSGNRCAFPECKISLVMDESETDDASIIGEEAHIVAQSMDGTRGSAELELEQRDKYNNLILLCSNHHKLIDDRPGEFTIEILKQFKEAHEKWVKENLSYDVKKQRDDELYTGYVEDFIQMAFLENWTAWTSYLLGGSNEFDKEVYESYEKIPKYIISRIWPHRYLPLENSFFNFKNVSNDLITVFNKHIAEKKSGDGYRIEKFYKNRYYSDQEYSELLKEYEYHIDLVEDLIIELTRSANYICDMVREYIFPSFRLKEGALLITRGPFMDFSFNTYRVEYRGEERTELPYPGLEKFMEIRDKRDLNVGSGINKSYFQRYWEE
jgi:hypothetical protein